jgi:hypothetical protein
MGTEHNEDNESMCVVCEWNGTNGVFKKVCSQKNTIEIIYLKIKLSSGRMTMGVTLLTRQASWEA